MQENEHVNLKDLFVYKLSLDLSLFYGRIYEKFDWETKKIEGMQLIRSIDSVGANIAEGYGRFHYLDRIKFYYNARGSLLESKHWCYLLFKREKITTENYKILIEKLNALHVNLNGFINACYKVRENESK